METRLRLLLVLAGFPEPQINVPEIDDSGRLVGRRHDLRYARSKVAIEYDGRHHVERIEQWEADRDRRESAEDVYRLIIVIAPDIYRHPGRTLARIHRILLDRGEPGVPKHLKTEWRRHFPDWT